MNLIKRLWRWYCAACGYTTNETKREEPRFRSSLPGKKL
jgi:hypothetical protein